MELPTPAGRCQIVCHLGPRGHLGSTARCGVGATHTEHSFRHMANWEPATGGKWMGMETVGVIGVE